MDNYSNNNKIVSNSEDKKLLINSAIGFIVLILQITVLLAYLSLLSGHEVNFMDADGNAYGKYVAQGGVLAWMPQAPEREGYTFDGWYLEDGTKINYDFKVKKNVKIYAKWTPDYIPPVTPIMPTGITFKSIAVHSHTLALDTDGDIYAWGDNFYGQLGDGTINNRRSPAKIEVPGIKFQAAAVGHLYSLALDTSGNIWAWGRNHYGQLGNGTEMDSLVPKQIVVTGTKFKAIAVGWYSNLALDTAGNIWTWGQNNVGQLGDGTTDDCYAPKQITNSGVNYVWIGAGSGHGVALDEDGYAWLWGFNDAGQLGDGTAINDAARRLPAIRAGGKQFVSLVSGWSHITAIDLAGNIWAWGNNAQGRIGDGTTIQRNSPVQIADDKNFKSVYGNRATHTFALDALDNLWTWGVNGRGQLGDDTTAPKYLPIPVQTAEGTKFKSIFGGGDCTVAVDISGNLWAWGNNDSGQLGDGTITQRNTPVMIYSKTAGYIPAEVSGTLADIYTIIQEGNAGAGIALAIAEGLIMAGFAFYVVSKNVKRKKTSI